MLQWGHDLSVMDTMPYLEIKILTALLQWGHDLSVMDTISGSLNRIQLTCSYKSFNGAMTFRSWIQYLENIFRHREPPTMMELHEFCRILPLVSWPEPPISMFYAQIVRALSSARSITGALAMRSQARTLPSRASYHAMPSNHQDLHRDRLELTAQGLHYLRAPAIGRAYVYDQNSVLFEVDDFG